MKLKKLPPSVSSPQFVSTSVRFDSVVPTPSPFGPICDCSISHLPRRSIVVKSSSPPSDSGSALILTLLITALLATIVVSFLSTSRVEQIAARNFSRQNAASGLAELATQQAMAQIQQGFTVNGTGTTVITTQPGAIRQFVFSGGSITSNTTTELFSGTGSASTNGTANLNNLQNPSSVSSATNNQSTITGISSESITIPMEEITIRENGADRVIGRIAYYVDDEGTKLNLNAATGTRTALNASTNRPLSLNSLTSLPWGQNFSSTRFSNIIDASTYNASNDVKTWTQFFRPEQVMALGAGLNATETPINLFTTATSTANSTANMPHLLTPWGTQRVFINELSTNATDGTGDASVSTIHSSLTNSTLTAIFGENFVDKYTSIGVKQIAANMLQMRDPNTATVNASFSYTGPLIGAGGNNSLNASTYIPQDYLGYAPYPVVSEVSVDVCYNNGAGGFLRPYVLVNVELYNPYPVAFNNANATLEYFMRGLTWNMTHTINSTGQTFGPYRYGCYGNWTDSSSSPEYFSQSKLRDAAKNNTQFPEDYFMNHNPYGIKGLSIPAYSKVKYSLIGPGWGTCGQAMTNLIFPFDPSDIIINSITDVRASITYIKIVGNSTIANSLKGAPNINSNTIRDWVLGVDVGPFIPNNGNLSYTAGGPGSSIVDIVRGSRLPNQYRVSNLPANSTVTFPRPAEIKFVQANATSGGNDIFTYGDWTSPPNNISRASYQRLCPLIKTSMAASSNLTASTRSWTTNTSTANQTFGNLTSASGITTANQTELLNEPSANPAFDSANAIPSDPSLSNFNGNSVYANATLSNGTLTNSSDMRIPELPNFSGNYRYTSPSDLGLVPTNQRWRRLRMQMQPASEGNLIPDWAMLDIISFGNSTNPNNAFNRMLPLNINGMFHLPGNATIAPRTIGVKALAQVLSYSGNSSVQDPTNPASPLVPLSTNETKRFKGNATTSANITTIVGAIGNMSWSANSTWGNATTGKRWKINGAAINNYILPSEIMEIAGVADAVSQGNYTNSSTHFKWNEGRASALIPAVTTRSSCFMVYAYAQALDKTGNIDSEALTKTMVEVQYNAGNYTVKKLYTQPIPLGP